MAPIRSTQTTREISKSRKCPSHELKSAEILKGKPGRKEAPYSSWMELRASAFRVWCELTRTMHHACESTALHVPRLLCDSGRGLAPVRIL